MSGKSKINVFNKMTKTALDKEISNEKFNVDYSLKQIGKIVRKLGYNYSKAYPKFSKSPEDAEEQLKKT